MHLLFRKRGISLEYHNRFCLSIYCYFGSSYFLVCIIDMPKNYSIDVCVKLTFQIANSLLPHFRMLD